MLGIHETEFTAAFKSLRIELDAVCFCRRLDKFRSGIAGCGSGEGYNLLNLGGILLDEFFHTGIVGKCIQGTAEEEYIHVGG